MCPWGDPREDLRLRFLIRSQGALAGHDLSEVDLDYLKPAESDEDLDEDPSIDQSIANVREVLRIAAHGVE